MKNVRLVMAMTLTAFLAQVEASVIVVLENPGNDGNTRRSTFSGLVATTVKSSYDKMIPSGAFSACDMGSAETFGVTVSGVSDWNYAAATGVSSVNAYLNSLTPADIEGNNSGWGVGGSGPDAGNLDGAAEALVFTFHLSGLTEAHQSVFRLRGIGMKKWKNGDAYTYMIVDTSGDQIVAKEAGMTIEMQTLDIPINDGDILVVGYKRGNFKFANFTVDVIAKPVQPTGEPAGTMNNPTLAMNEPVNVESKMARREDRKAAKKEERKLAKANSQPADLISKPIDPILQPPALGLVLW